MENVQLTAYWSVSFRVCTSSFVAAKGNQEGKPKPCFVPGWGGPATQALGQLQSLMFCFQFETKPKAHLGLGWTFPVSWTIEALDRLRPASLKPGGLGWGWLRRVAGWAGPDPLGKTPNEIEYNSGFPRTFPFNPAKHVGIPSQKENNKPLQRVRRQPASVSLFSPHCLKWVGSYLLVDLFQSLESVCVSLRHH